MDPAGSLRVMRALMKANRPAGAMGDNMRHGGQLVISQDGRRFYNQWGDVAFTAQSMDPAAARVEFVAWANRNSIAFAWTAR